MEIFGPSMKRFLMKCMNQNAADVYEELAGQNIYVRYFNYEGLADKLRITTVRAML